MINEKKLAKKEALTYKFSYRNSRISIYFPCKPPNPAITFVLSTTDNTSHFKTPIHGIRKLDKRKLHRRRIDTTGHPPGRHTASACGQDGKPDHGPAPTIRTHSQPEQAHRRQGEELHGATPQLGTQFLGQDRVRQGLQRQTTHRKPRAVVGKPLTTAHRHQDPVGSRQLYQRP